jgi:hypothetical protein
MKLKFYQYSPNSQCRRIYDGFVQIAGTGQGEQQPYLFLSLCFYHCFSPIADKKLGKGPIKHFKTSYFAQQNPYLLNITGWTRSYHYANRLSRATWNTKRTPHAYWYTCAPHSRRKKDKWAEAREIRKVVQIRTRERLRSSRRAIRATLP